MNTFAFGLVGFMLAMYVVLDGYDLGVAAITPLIARTSAEREGALSAIRPFRDGNEVWLIAAGGALFALFPKAYASSFSGFYLPFMVVLWLLMFRGIAMELRNHFASPIWHDFWDFCFAGSSALLIGLLGVAMGNLIRGLPLDANGYFTGTFGFLLNPYAVLVGVLAFSALVMHGGIYLTRRLEGPLADRARKLLGRLIPLEFFLYVVTTVATAFTVSTNVQLWWGVFPLISLLALGAVLICTGGANPRGAFLASSAYLVSLLAAAAATMYPFLLPGFPNRAQGLSIDASAPSPVAITSALIAIVTGVCVVIAYRTAVGRAMHRHIVVGRD
jgi:cytochrome d ubiquinol oxidase subunit II